MHNDSQTVHMLWSHLSQVGKRLIKLNGDRLMGRNVVIIGTLDTKGPEIAYLRDRLIDLGLDTTEDMYMITHPVYSKKFLTFILYNPRYILKQFLTML